jgi:hypothetical protein
MCQINQILNSIFNSFCTKNKLTAIFTCMQNLVNSCIFYKTFHCYLLDFLVKKKKTLKFYFSVFFIFDMPIKICANLRLACIMLEWQWMPSLWNSCMFYSCFSTNRQRFQATGRNHWSRNRRLRVKKNLRELAIGMLNAGMTMNAVAMNIRVCSTRAIRHIDNVFKQQDVQTDYVMDVRASRRVLWPL